MKARLYDGNMNLNRKDGKKGCENTNFCVLFSVLTNCCNRFFF